MRTLVLFVVAAFVTACGSDSKPAAASGLGGTVGGRSFSPAAVRAIPAGSGASPCPVMLGPTTVNVGVKALALEVTSYADACGDFASSQCRFHQSAQSVTLLVAKLNPAGSEPALATGTYTIASSPTTVVPEASGLLTVAFAQALGTDATCGGTPSPSVQGGTLRLDQVTGPVTGHVSVTFQDGSSLAGDFSAPLCPGPSPDVCSLATAQALCTLPPVCVPYPTERSGDQPQRRRGVPDRPRVGVAAGTGRLRRTSCRATSTITSATRIPTRPPIASATA